MARGPLVRALLRLSRPLWRIRRFALWSEEIFWGRWLKTHRQQIADALAPDRAFPENLRPYIDHLGRGQVDILEVGAGPFGSIGLRHPGKTIRVTPTDILAAQYERMLARQKIVPPVRTIFADAERLVAQFGGDTFDLVYATNCVDHMERPLLALAEMLSVVRNGGAVVLYHEIDEGAEQDYAGLHQWNLNVDGGHFIVWNETERHDVTTLLAGTAEVMTEVRNDHLFTALTKRRDGVVTLTSAPAPAR
jgi:SAM-dependent methyltransferase